ncbi:ABC transporter ATP-binding protein [Cupriavidus basilensis]|uniref:ABC transporter ATP-binding protein n=1 Tax=Cupriavidus basilensis TaxID=68895 RepID=UPI0009E656A9|nr:ABC transporter ATP-binding protein [Cupriavidus basilensis]
MNAVIAMAAAKTQACEPSKQADVAVRVENVSKWFDTHEPNGLTVLKDISFEVPRGSVVALVGTSGCGKSTLLNIVSGLIKADRGSITYDGKVGKDFDDWSKVTYMFQEDRLLPWRTTIDNVAFGLEAGSMPKRERRERAGALLELVGLQAFADAYPHQLSGGMRSRVALARSLIGEPKILLMDEPFSKLDPSIRTQMHEEILRIHRLKHLTVVFVTHDVEEAVVLADRVVVLSPRPGRVKEIVDIDIPRPRNYLGQPFVDKVRELRQLL